MNIEYPVPADVHSTHLPFSPATKVANLIFVSGQASTDQRGQVISDTFENEFRRSVENVRRILREGSEIGNHTMHHEEYPGLGVR